MAGTTIRLTGPGYDLTFDMDEDIDPIRNAAGKRLNGDVNAVAQFDLVVEQARGALVAATEIQKRQATDA